MYKELYKNPLSNFYGKEWVFEPDELIDRLEDDGIVDIVSDEYRSKRTAIFIQYYLKVNRVNKENVQHTSD